jgi:Protein of unknown function (DUF3606)
MGFEDLLADPMHADQVDLNAHQSVAYWQAALQVSEETLRRAIAEVGPAISELRDHLGR